VCGLLAAHARVESGSSGAAQRSGVTPGWTALMSAASTLWQGAGVRYAGAGGN